MTAPRPKGEPFTATFEHGLKRAIDRSPEWQAIINRICSGEPMPSWLAAKELKEDDADGS